MAKRFMAYARPLVGPWTPKLEMRLIKDPIQEISSPTFIHKSVLGLSMPPHSAFMNMIRVGAVLQFSPCVISICSTYSI